MTSVASPITDLLGAVHQIHDFWVASFRAAEVDVNLTEELRHAETNPTCEIHESYCTFTLTFETRILRSDIFAKVNLMSVAPTLQNLRIGLKRRQSGKSKVPREAAWKLAKSVLNLKEQERATFFSPSETRCLPASILKLEERECCPLWSVDAYDQQKGLE